MNRRLMVVVNDRLHARLEQLRETGLYGASVEDVVVRLVEREVEAAVVTGLVPKKLKTN